MDKWFEKNTIGIAHEDERRAIICPFNGDFVARQVKILKIKKDSTLGNHYHGYRELFYVFEGRAIYYLENIFTKEKCSVVLQEGDRLIIGAGVAHKVNVSDGTLMVEATGKAYISPENNDVRYEINWAGI